MKVIYNYLKISICGLALFSMSLNNKETPYKNLSQLLLGAANVACVAHTLVPNNYTGEVNVTQGYQNPLHLTFSSSLNTDYNTAIIKACGKTLLAPGATPNSLTYSNSTSYYSTARGNDDGFASTNFVQPADAEPTIYRGGNGDGFVLACFDQGANAALTMYKGGIEDGFVSACFDQGANVALTMYRGGIEDGFVSACFDQGANAALTMYRGGIEDGFVSACFDQGANATLTMYRGGIEDGFVSACFDQGINAALTMFRGGNDDGFASYCYIEGENSINVVVKVVLGGVYFSIGDTMGTSLRILGLLPIKCPYDTTIVLNTLPTNMVDWIRLDLVDTLTGDTTYASQCACLLKNGTIQNISADTTLAFAISNKPYVSLRIKHRNHLSARSRGLANAQGVPISFDFRSGTNLYIDPTITGIGFHNIGLPELLIGSRYTLWPGDANGDGQIKYQGSANDRGVILAAIGGTVITNTVNGYLNADVNLNGQVKYQGSVNDRALVLSSIGGTNITKVSKAHD